MKLLKLFLSVIIVSLIYVPLKAQNNTWYFGNNAGMHFSNGSVIALTNGASFAYDCSASISDGSGNLIIYTDGTTIYNKNHVAMANGTGILGNINGGQVAIIVPQPSSSNIYYVFTVDAFAGSNGFRYHVVDISLNSGLGAVTSKNNLLFSPSTEKLDAVYNSCDNSYWILTHRWNSNTFSAYKLTSTGLNTTPVNTNIGANLSGNTNNGIGQLTFADNGKRVANALYDIGAFELYDFNMSTGVLSNLITIPNYTRAWGTAFSPDNSLLYVTQWYGQNITQFNLNAGSVSSIINSAVSVGNASGPGTSGYHIGYLELAPDDKIYAAVYDDTYLAVINSPNKIGINCNMVDNGFYLAGKKSNAGLCRTVQYPRHLNEMSICEGDSILIFGNYESNSGKYTDTIKTSLNCDSIVVISLVVNQAPNVTINNFSNDTVCTKTPPILLPQGNPSGGYYTGSTGITGNYFDPSLSGAGNFYITYNYTDNNGCKNADSTLITVTYCLGINEFLNSNISVYPNPNDGNFIINLGDYDEFIEYEITSIDGRIINTGSNTSKLIPINISNESNGIYIIKVSDKLSSKFFRINKL